MAKLELFKGRWELFTGDPNQDPMFEKKSDKKIELKKTPIRIGSAVEVNRIHNHLIIRSAPPYLGSLVLTGKLRKKWCVIPDKNRKITLYTKDCEIQVINGAYPLDNKDTIVIDRTLITFRK